MDEDTSHSFLHNGFKPLLLVDAHALIYRAYFAFPELTTSTGQLVNAVFGFTRILLTAIRDLDPEYIAVLFDHPQPTFRHEAFADYKAHREKMPDDLRPQIDLVKQVVDALNMPRFDVAGFEADDLIGSMTVQATELSRTTEPELRTLVLTGDRDIFQLVSDYMHVLLPNRGSSDTTEYDSDAVQKKMGVTPAQIVDMKALMGDSSDNIPGIAGIGPKTAVRLLEEFNNLDGIFAALANLETGKGSDHGILKGSLLTKLTEGKEAAYLSQQLAQIATTAPITLHLADCMVKGYDKPEASELLQKLEFNSLISLLPADEFESGVQDALF